MTERAVATHTRWLLVSDLDDTLTGDAEALDRLISAARHVDGLTVAINSSRPVASVEDTLATFPEGWRPAAVIGAMGSQIQIEGQSLADWPHEAHDWDRARITQALKALGFEAHDESLQGPYKVSYTVPPTDQQTAIDAVRATGIAVQTIISGETNLDVIPASTGKSAAIKRLATHFGATIDDALIVAGDSANDLSMFELSPRGIVVGNAHEALKDYVSPEHVYFAAKSHAAGVLEGLVYWGVVASPADA